MLIRPLEQIVPIDNCANASDPTTRNVPTPPPPPQPLQLTPLAILKQASPVSASP